MSPDPNNIQPGFVVVGLGKMGIMHAAMLSANPNAKVAAIVDQNLMNAKHLRSMGVKAPCFVGLEQCLDTVQPEGVFIATPQFTHRTLIECCLQRQIPVFCEKPLAHTLEDALAIEIEAQQHPQVPFTIGYQLAHHPLFEQAAHMLQKESIGELKSFRASCRLSQVFSPKQGWTFTSDKAGGGVLINSGCHLLYSLIMLFGRPCGVSVRGSGVHNEVEDTMTAIIDYSTGLWGTVEATWSVPGHEWQTNDIEVIGTEGTLEVGNQWLRLWRVGKGKLYPAGWSQWDRQQSTPKAPFSLSPDYSGDEFYLEDLDFVEAARGKRKPKVKLSQALLVQELLDALYRSMDSGRTIELSEVKRP